MAFINKLFSSRKKTHAKHQDNICEKLFAFSNDQVRVVLFRECDYRGRKLLFDSTSVQKILLTNENTNKQDVTPSENKKPNKKFMEVSNGFGYMCSKPNADTVHLGEMVFGSVAMSYRGASYKIHSLLTPSRIMCTQVFPSPKHGPRSTRSSAPNQGTSAFSLDQNIKSEDSGTSCTTSSSDPQSIYSNTSDTLLVCKEKRSSPLDVPLTNGNILRSNIPSYKNGDSGCGGDQSCSSGGSGSNSVIGFDLNTQGNAYSFSSGSLTKRWLRSASTSLDYSTSSLTGSASADECYTRPSIRSSKLGLAVIVQLTEGEEENMERFFMEHAPLIEMMVSRARQGVETAYARQMCFFSIMMDVVTTSSKWLTQVLSGPKISNHLWLSLVNTCDNFNSIRTTQTCHNFSEPDSLLRVNGNVKRTLSLSVGEHGTNCLDMSVSGVSSSYESNTNSDFTLFNFSKFWSSEWDVSRGRKNTIFQSNPAAEKFVKELCELLETIDVKHTNFFLSTLITAVLTHHLGWVSTTNPPTSSEKEAISKLSKTYNPLWGQLAELFGAIGQPAKVSQTIICGSSKPDIIPKIISTLTYFIRCCDIERKEMCRKNVSVENEIADEICQKNSCIPKENYKKYEDHLKEIGVRNNKFCKLTETKENWKISEIKESTETLEPLLQSRPMGMKKIATCFKDLTKLTESECCNEELFDDEHICESNKIFPLLNKVTNMNFKTICKEHEEHDAKHEKAKKLNSLYIQQSAALVYPILQNDDKQNLIDIQEAREQIEKVFSPKKAIIAKNKYPNEFNFDTPFIEKYMSVEDKNNENDLYKENKVIFVLGEDEKLIGIKKNKSIQPANDNISKRESPQKVIDTKKRNGAEQPPLTRSVSINSKDYALKDIKNSFERKILPLPNKHNKNVSNEKDNHIEISSKDFGKPLRPTTLDLSENPKFYCHSSDSSDESNDTDFFKNSVFKDDDFKKFETNAFIKPSNSWTSLQLCEGKNKELESANLDAACGLHNTIIHEEPLKDKEFVRCQSVPPCEKPKTSDKNDVKPKYHYSGVKFNFQQYPKILSNYMKSKNIELTNLPFPEKAMQFNKLPLDFDVPTYETNDFEEVEALQTPSNASELEYVSELDSESSNKADVGKLGKEILDDSLEGLPVSVLEEIKKEKRKENVFSRAYLESAKGRINNFKLVEIPMPVSIEQTLSTNLPMGYTQSLIRGLGDDYISDMILQGTSMPKRSWETLLKKDLILATRHPLLDQPIQEAVAIVANTDSWEVQLMSSHTFVIDRGSSGVRIGMSQLVADMLESLLIMWKNHMPPQFCLMHIEQRLQEFYMQSKALAQLLLETDFCSMELLTKTLHLEVNDVPLLMAIASTHSPQLMQKYGLSFS